MLQGAEHPSLGYCCCLSLEFELPCIPRSQLPQLAASVFLVPIMVTTPLDWKLQAPAGLCPRREVHDVGLCSFPAS